MTDLSALDVGKLVLCVLVVFGLAGIGAIDLTQDYHYSDELRVEGASSVPDNVDPVEFDELSNSEREMVLSVIGTVSEVEDVPEEFDRAGYLSINGELYEYEVSPTVSNSFLDAPFEALVSMLMMIGSAIIMIGFINILLDEFSSSREVVGALLVVFLILGAVPMAQIVMFSETNQSTGTVTYLGEVDDPESATEFSSLSYEQQAYVMTLSSKEYNSNELVLDEETKSPEDIKVSMSTDMDQDELDDLDTVVMKSNGEEEYHNFVTTDVETDGFGFTFSEKAGIFGIIVLYIFMISVIAHDILINHNLALGDSDSS